jgi:hypothetical protein
MVALYNGKPKSNQNAHHVVLDIEVGKRETFNSVRVHEALVLRNVQGAPL